MSKYGRGDLLPTSDKGCILDVQGGGEAESAIGNGCKELYVVFRG